MAGTILSGTYTSGIGLSNPATQRHVTVTSTGKITNTPNDAIFGNAAFAWTVSNSGTVQNTGAGGVGGEGVQLLDGGAVSNAAAGLIAGYFNGILIKGAAGAVDNLGTIHGNGANRGGVSLTEGGRVTNGSTARTTALIDSGGSVINISDAVGTVTNFGSIQSAIGTGVNLNAGGSVANGSAASTAALISGATGVYVGNASGRVTNFGKIAGANIGVRLRAGGSVSNGRSGKNAGQIVGTGSVAVYITGATGTVANFGTIQEMTGTVATVVLNAGGAVNNGAVGATSAVITGLGTGVYINNGAGAVTNFGIVRSTSISLGTAVVLERGGIVTNFGTIQNASTGNAGVYFVGSGSVINGKTGTSVGTISGGGNAISFRGGAETVTNAGSIKSSSSNGVYLTAGGSVTNQVGAVLAGYKNGVYNRGAPISLTNAGLIETTGAGNGAYIRGGGAITNNAGGTIAGGGAGVEFGQQGGIVTNRGLVKGVIGFDGGVHHAGDNTLINFGTVASTTGAGGVAVDMGNGSGAKLLVIEPGAKFVGAVQGGGKGVVQFAPSSVVGMTGVSGFATVALANTVAQSLTLTDANFTGVSGGRITVVGGNAGDTVTDASTTGRATTAIGGLGKDLFTGGSGNDVFQFTAKTLNAVDVVKGGGGFDDRLVLTSAGTIAAGGVSAVEVYRLTGGGANTLKLTNGNFANVLGGHISVYGGAGGNAIDGSGLSAAADNLIIYGGAGADVLKGGAGNDIFVFAAAALTATDTVAGGKGNDELLLTTAGTVHAAKVSGVESYVLADGGLNTLILASGNFASLAGNAIAISDGDGGTILSATAEPAADHIVVSAGAGVDKLTGGAGADIFNAGGKTAMKGGGGGDQFRFSAIGSNTIADFSAAAGDEAVVDNAGFNLGILGLTGTPQLLPASFFTKNATGSFTNAAQRFAYDTANGTLFYSASGTTATEHLVTTLTGHPGLDHLFVVGSSGGGGG